MACECRTGERSLLLLAPDLSRGYPELCEFNPGDSWEPLPEQGVVRVHIGPDGPWKTAADVVDFIRTVIDASRFHALRAAWSSGCCSTPDVRRATEPQPLSQFARLDANPLLGILQERRIDTWFQPVFRRDFETLWGYECLMRGRGDDGKTVFPNDLLAWARQEHLIFMLDRVCRERHLENAGAANLPADAHLLINFLPTAIYEPSFCLRTTMAAAQRCGIAPSRIIFEVVESEQMHDRERLASILGYYRKHGFKVALDDVGAGYSGLMMLADLNPDLIKIDRALITKAPASAMHRGICRALIELAHEVGKLALAEGVETVEERDLLAELGADLFQGYLFGKPHPTPATAPLQLAA